MLTAVTRMMAVMMQMAGQRSRWQDGAEGEFRAGANWQAAREPEASVRLAQLVRGDSCATVRASHEQGGNHCSRACSVAGAPVFHIPNPWASTLQAAVQREICLGDHIPKPRDHRIRPTTSPPVFHLLPPLPHAHSPTSAPCGTHPLDPLSTPDAPPLPRLPPSPPRVMQEWRVGSPGCRSRCCGGAAAAAHAPPRRPPHPPCSRHRAPLRPSALSGP